MGILNLKIKKTNCLKKHYNKMRVIFASCLLLISINQCFANWGWGGCPPQVAPMPDFDLQKYLGVWYEIERFDSSFEDGLECVTANYSRLDNSTVRVINQGYDPIEMEPSLANGTAVVRDPRVPNALAVSFPFRFLGFEIDFSTGNYDIYDVDYNSHVTVYSCSNFWIFHVEYGWVLSRTPELDAGLTQKLKDQLAMLTGHDGLVNNFMKVNQKCQTWNFLDQMMMMPDYLIQDKN